MTINNQQQAGQGLTLEQLKAMGYGSNNTRSRQLNLTPVNPPPTPGRNPARVINERAQQNGSSNTTSFPADLPPIHFNMIHAEFKTAKDHALGKLVSKGTISFPVPLQMSDPHRVIYNDGYSYLGAVGQAGSTIAQGTGNPSTAQFEQAAGAILGALGRAVGFSINSFKGVTIEQPQFKNHQFTWKFSPKTKEETILLQQILYNLKKSSALRFANEGSNRFVFSFPDVFIPFFSNSPMMYKFKPCVISGVDVDYVGGNEGPSFFRDTDGPESITLQLSLLELEYWVRSDFEQDEVDGLPSENPFGAWNWHGIDGVKGRGEGYYNAATGSVSNAIGTTTTLGNAIANQFVGGT